MSKNIKNTAEKQEEIYINGRAFIALCVTLALLVLCLVPMFIGIAMDNSGGEPVGGGSGGGGGGSVSVNAKPNTPSKPSEKGSKTGIVLPCATAEGTYYCESDGQTSDIAENTSVKSEAMALIDITDGRAVALKNGDAKVYPASMTKVMTLLVACENAKDPNALLTVTAEMVSKYNKSENQDASVAFTWKEGNQVTVEDALYTVIYKSDTYACWLLADYVAGSEEAFVGMMNDRARSLGLTATNFTNCTGLYNENHYTTCREMAAIMAAVMNNKTATAVITRTDKYTIDLYADGLKTEETQDMWCDWYTGRLEKYPWGAAAPYYAGNGSDMKIIAGKTGWETIPTSCFVTSAVDDVTGRRYVCVQVGRTDKSQTSINTKTSTNDTRIVYQKYAVE